MKRYFTLRHRRTRDTYWVYVIARDSLGTLRFRGFMSARSALAPVPEDMGWRSPWQALSPSTAQELFNRDLWVEFGEQDLAITIEYIQYRTGDILNDPLVRALAITSPEPEAPSPIPTPKTIHKIGVPKNKLP